MISPRHASRRVAKRPAVITLKAGDAVLRQDRGTGHTTIRAPRASYASRDAFLKVAHALAKAAGTVVWQCHSHPVERDGGWVWEASAAAKPPTGSRGRYGEA